MLAACGGAAPRPAPPTAAHAPTLALAEATPKSAEGRVPNVHSGQHAQRQHPELETTNAHAEPPTEHAHAHAHAPLVHRFERADDWVAQFDDPARDAWQQPAKVVEAMQIEAGMVVADIGAGTGYFEPHLSRAVGPAGSVLALDVEPDMVRYLRERTQREQLKNVTPGLVKTDDPGLDARSVDRVLIVDTWHHIPERTTYARKLLAGLKPGGELYVVDFTQQAAHGPPVHHRVAPEQVVRELVDAGFEAKLAAVTLPEQYAVVAKRPSAPKP